jgi:hypothetical protein
MLRKCIVSLGLLMSAVAMPALAAPKEIFLTMSTSGIDFYFEPNQSTVFTNAFPWQLKATCQVVCDDSVLNSMQAKILKKFGILNDQRLEVNQSMCLDIHDGDKFSLVAPQGSKVEIKNTGASIIKANCFVGG